jgi:hypothetical protein
VLEHVLSFLFHWTLKLTIYCNDVTDILNFICVVFRSVTGMTIDASRQARSNIHGESQQLLSVSDSLTSLGIQCYPYAAQIQPHIGPVILSLETVRFKGRSDYLQQLANDIRALEKKPAHLINRLTNCLLQLIHYT